MPNIIDAHSHYMPPAVAENTAFFKVAWSDIDRQLSLMDECGIEKALLLYPTSDAHVNMGGWQKVCDAYNPSIAEILKAHEGRFIGAGILPADCPELFKDELKRIKDLGLKVLTLASSYEGVYLDDERFYPVYEFARDNEMPVHVHPQIMNPIGEERVKDPLLTPVLEYVFDVSVCIGKMMMSGTFLEFPEVKFIFAHYGGVLPFVKERFDNTYMMLRRRNFVKDLTKLPGDYFRNLYFDMSGTKSNAALQAALEVVDPSHILFGSDFPANQNVRQSIAVIEDALLSDEDKVKIMKNAVFSGI
jgi:predicted TIM-barrel fold metal-dependent hydrolase